jgi:hypothetical protein
MLHVSRAQRVEDQKFTLFIVGFSLVMGLYMALMANYAFVKPTVVQTVVAQIVR